MSVFLSYRRADSAHALWLYPRLIQWFGRERVFWDRKDIDPGADFAAVIDGQIRASNAFVAIVGPNWLEATDEQGQRRIDSPDDWIRRETVLALGEGLLVIPVLVTGLAAPGVENLPADLRRFAQLQMLSMGDMGFHDVLRESLEKVVSPAVREAVVDNPDRVRLQRRAGTLLRRQVQRVQVRAAELIQDGKIDRASEELSEGSELLMALLDLIPDDTTLEAQLGYLFGTMGQAFHRGGNEVHAQRYLDLAMSVFERVKADPAQSQERPADLASAIKGIGGVRYERGDMAGAIRDYRTALEIDSTYCYAWHDLFLAYDGLALQGSVDLAAMREAIDKTRETGAGYPGLGKDKFEMLESRFKMWQQRVVEFPDLDAGTERRLTAAIAQGGAEADTYWRRARIRLASHDNAGGEADLTEAIARGLDTAQVRFVRGLSRGDQQNAAGAEADFTAAIARGRDDADVYYWRARVRMDLGDAGSVDADMTAAIERGRDQGDSYYLRALGRYIEGRLPDAYEDCTSAIARDVDAAGVFQLRAQIGARIGRLEHLAKDCERAQELAPDEGETHTAWASWHMAEGRYDEAAARYRLHPAFETATSVQFMLAIAMLLGGHAEESIQQLVRALPNASVTDVTRVLREIDTWTTRHPPAPEIVEVVAGVTDRLRQFPGLAAAAAVG